MNSTVLTLAPSRPTVVVEVHGDLDALTAPRLHDTVVRLLDQRPPLLVLDLRPVTFLGVSGVAALIAIRQRTGGQTRLQVLADGPATRLLRLTGVDRHVNAGA
jgi:anti-sigma B factor antagonist